MYYYRKFVYSINLFKDVGINQIMNTNSLENNVTIERKKEIS